MTTRRLTFNRSYVELITSTYPRALQTHTDSCNRCDRNYLPLTPVP